MLTYRAQPSSGQAVLVVADDPVCRPLIECGAIAPSGDDRLEVALHSGRRGLCSDAIEALGKCPPCGNRDALARCVSQSPHEAIRFGFLDVQSHVGSWRFTLRVAGAAASVISVVKQLWAG